MNKNQNYNMYGWTDTFTNQTTLESSTDLKISIVIPTLNHEDTIEDTLRSIIYQNDGNYEIIVMDGGSRDNTRQIIEKYRDYIAYYQSGQDGGQSEAINKGFAMASGDIYAWINSDDFYLPNAFATIRKAFAENQEIDIVVGSGDVVTKDCQFLKHIKAIEMERDILLEWHNDQWIMQQCCFWKAEIWKKSGGVDEGLHLLMDYDLWLRFAIIGKSIGIEDKIAIMRFYKEAKTIAYRSRTKEEEAYVYAKNEAFTNLRELVRDLSMSNERLKSRVEGYERHVINRVLKRLGAVK